MTRAARAQEIACDSRKQKLYRLNRPLEDVLFSVVIMLNVNLFHVLFIVLMYVVDPDIEFTPVCT